MNAAHTLRDIIWRSPLQASAGLFKADLIELFDTENGKDMFFAVAGKPCNRLLDSKTDHGAPTGVTTDTRAADMTSVTS